MSEPSSTYHRDVAMIHFAGKLGGSFQAKYLLSTIWGCVADPWEDSPKVFLAASRLQHVIACNTGRCAAIRKLVKIGALKKGVGTRSGCLYTLRRPQVSELSQVLRNELSAMSERDYRWNPNAAREESTGVAESTREKQPALERPPTPRHTRRDISKNNKTIGLDFPALARFVEIFAKLKKGSVRYAKGSRDVEALGAWFIEHQILGGELKPLLRMLRRSRVNKPAGDALRYAFEGDTSEKQCYLASILSDLQQLRDAQKPVGKDSEDET